MIAACILGSDSDLKEEGRKERKKKEVGRSEWEKRRILEKSRLEMGC